MVMVSVIHGVTMVPKHKLVLADFHFLICF
jgi:hypothetical protein